MIRLINNAALEWSIDATITSAQLHGTVSYLDMPRQDNVNLLSQLGTEEYSKISAAGDLTACPAPVPIGTVRNIDEAAFYNADSVTHQLTVKINNSGTDYLRVKQSLNPRQTLQYSSANGWGVL